MACAGEGNKNKASFKSPKQKNYRTRLKKQKQDKIHPIKE